LRRALLAVGELAEIDDLAEYPRRVAELLRRVIPCHHAGYTAVELGTGRVTIAADPADSVFPGGPEIFARFAHQNPMLSDLARTGDQHSKRLSDYISSRELHRTELYDQVYRLIPLEFQIGVPMPAPGRDLGRPAEVVGLSLVRVERDFSDAEMALAELVRPHLAQTLRRLHELALLRASRDGETNDRWVLLVEGAGVVAWISEAATEALGLRVGDPLPALLRRWLGSELAHPGDEAVSPAAWGSPLTIAGIRMQPRLLSDAYPGLHALHLRPLLVRPTLAALRGLGLTLRQAQALQLALAGRTSREAAMALELSPRTVEKHMAAAYGRLGAANRTEAVLIAARALAR
jgi:DNA-binding CsgD family transcriptional regulator